MGDVVIVVWIVYGSVYEMVDEDGVGVFVYFVFDWIGVYWDFDDYVEVIG